MNLYESDLEVQNEELKQLLASTQKQLEEIKQSPFQYFKKRIHDYDDYAYVFYCNISMKIKDNSNLSHNECNKLAEEIMDHLFDTRKYLENYPR
jgi:hypothetical protein